MKFTETGFDGLWEIKPSIFEDHRGYFMESFQSRLFRDVGITDPFVQDNQSFSKKGVLRGLHFQKAPHEQGKLVSVTSGSVLDVVVDLRPDSDTFGKYYKCLLDNRQHNMLFVPAGFAHGFLALEDSLFTYKCTEFYHKQSEMGIFWNDPQLNIDWGDLSNPIISEKDRALPGFQEVVEILAHG